jgi:dihydrodipicolinate synthase/N-acetylneuraminate lyase
LDKGETKRLEITSASALAGRGDGVTPLYLSLSGNNTCKLVKQTTIWPIDYFFDHRTVLQKPLQERMFQNFTAAAAEATERPISLYNIRNNTSVSLVNEGRSDRPSLKT